jgi:hypothetical protein
MMHFGSNEGLLVGEAKNLPHAVYLDNGFRNATEKKQQKSHFQNTNTRMHTGM